MRMSRRVMMNSPKLGSSVNEWTPWPTDSTMTTDELYSTYPAATMRLPTCSTSATPGLSCNKKERKKKRKEEERKKKERRKKEEIRRKKKKEEEDEMHAATICAVCVLRLEAVA